jgi:putative Holliday junction resolvase
MPEAGTLLGIDYGKRCTGLAIAHPLTGSARPLAPLNANNDEALLRQVLKVLADWKPSQVVIGLPLSGSGDETDLSRAVRRFAAQLQQHLPELAIGFQDERLTSVAAAERHTERRQQGRARQRDARQLDSVAASLILEAWMQDHR